MPWPHRGMVGPIDPRAAAAAPTDVTQARDDMVDAGDDDDGTEYEFEL